MNPSECLEALQDEVNKMNKIVQQIKDIASLDKNRDVNALRLREILNGVRKALEGLDFSGRSDIRGVLAWLEAYSVELADAEQRFGAALGRELACAIQEMGSSLTGHYPSWQAGLFTIEIDQVKRTARLWYGPKEEHIEDCTLRPEKIAARLTIARKDLGCQLEEGVFLDKLRNACLCVAAQSSARPIPITAVLPKLAFLLQSNVFLHNPKREFFKSYTRADFSFDLYRTLSQPRQTRLLGSGFRLIVATRSETNRRQDFLWVPLDDDGGGQRYSKLQIGDD